MNNLKKKQCPLCKQDRLIPHRQGEYNPNPISANYKVRICLDCFMDETYAKFGVEA